MCYLVGEMLELGGCFEPKGVSPFPIGCECAKVGPYSLSQVFILVWVLNLATQDMLQEYFRSHACAILGNSYFVHGEAIKLCFCSIDNVDFCAFLQSFFDT